MQPKRGAICNCDLGLPRPPPDLCRAGGVAKQAAVGSTEGGAVKQSEAILDGVFLSSPILSFARKRKNGKKKKTCPLHWISFCPRGCVRCAGPSIFLVLGKKDEGERTRTHAACERPLSGLFAPPPLPGVSPAALVGSKNPSIIASSQVLRSFCGADLG